MSVGQKVSDIAAALAPHLVDEALDLVRLALSQKDPQAALQKARYAVLADLEDAATDAVLRAALDARLARDAR